MLRSKSRVETGVFADSRRLVIERNQMMYSELSRASDVAIRVGPVGVGVTFPQVHTIRPSPPLSNGTSHTYNGHTDSDSRESAKRKCMP
jgi:hypothetical protein